MSMSQVKHVLIMPSWYPKSGKDINGVFFRDQAVALARAGNKVGVIVPEERSIRQLLSGASAPDAPSYEMDEGVMTYRRAYWNVLPRVPFGTFVLFLINARRLLKKYISEQGRPDVIHAHVAVFAGCAALILGRALGLPVVITEHSSRYARGALPRWQLLLARRAFSGAASRIVVSPSLGDMLSEVFPEDNLSWKWIPNIVAERFAYSERAGPLHRPIRFVNVAMMTEIKGQLDLIQAFKQVKDAGVDAQLWLAGDGPLREELEKAVRELGLGHAVCFFGAMAPDRVPALLEASDVMVISSRYETFGVVAAEALTMGMPVVATRCGGPECIVLDGDGILVAPQDREALALAMRDIALRLPTYNHGSIANRASQRFSGPAIASRLVAEYERVLSLPGELG